MRGTHTGARDAHGAGGGARSRGGVTGYAAAAFVFTVGMAGTTLPTPLYGLYRAQLHFSEFMVTVVFAVYAVGVIAALLLAGNSSDVLGRRPVLCAALLFSVASAACFLLEGGLAWIFAGRLLSGFSAGLLTGAGTAAVQELAPGRAEGRTSFAATAANMGGLGCGPLLAGVLAQYAAWPLRLPYWTHLGLVVVALALLAVLPETVERRGPRSLPRPQGLSVPRAVRPVFVPAALACFAGFSVFGLFTAVSPGFLAGPLGIRNLAVEGAMVFCVFFASLAGQALTNRFRGMRALPVGCLTMAAGMAVVGLSLLLSSLPLMVVGAVAGGMGQGLAFRSAVAAIGSRAPEGHRGGTVSALFVVAYVGISLPVIGVGALTLVMSLRGAGLVFSACVVAVALGVAAYLPRVERREADAGGHGD